MKLVKFYIRSVSTTKELVFITSVFLCIYANISRHIFSTTPINALTNNSAVPPKGNNFNASHNACFDASAAKAFNPSFEKSAAKFLIAYPAPSFFT